MALVDDKAMWVGSVVHHISFFLLTKCFCCKMCYCVYMSPILPVLILDETMVSLIDTVWTDFVNNLLLDPYTICRRLNYLTSNSRIGVINHLPLDSISRMRLLDFCAELRLYDIQININNQTNLAVLGMLFFCFALITYALGVNPIDSGHDILLANEDDFLAFVRKIARGE